MKIFGMWSLKHWKLNKGAPCQKKNDAGEWKESEVLEQAVKSCDLDKGALCHASQRIWGEVWKCAPWRVGFGQGSLVPKIVMPQRLIEEPWRVVSWTREPLANSNIGEKQRIGELLAQCHWLELYAKDHCAIVLNWRTLKSCKLDKRVPLVQLSSIESHYWWCHYVTGLWSVTLVTCWPPMMPLERIDYDTLIWSSVAGWLSTLLKFILAVGSGLHFQHLPSLSRASSSLKPPPQIHLFSRLPAVGSSTFQQILLLVGSGLHFQPRLLSPSGVSIE